MQVFVTDSGVKTYSSNYFIHPFNAVGPYRFWHHQHHFRLFDGGVEMIDIVHYAVPWDFFGRLAERFFVRRKLKEIFDFRFRKVEDLFGSWQNKNEN